MRICSLLPSATEILYALGLGDSVVGVTHECDFPPEASAKPALIRPRVDPQGQAAEIDRQVSELASRGESIYAVDVELLVSIAPDLIITQDLCHVCAASPEDLATAIMRLSKTPSILLLAPHSLKDVWNDVRRVGQASGRSTEADALASALTHKVELTSSRTANLAVRPRVLCLEWLDPYYVAGHWVPEMVAQAGGLDVMGRAGEPSFRVSEADISRAEPDVILVMPCGYSLPRVVADFEPARIAGSWKNCGAVREHRIFAVDANSYFSRPGPRLSDGVALLAHIFHSNLCADVALPAMYQRL